MRILRKYQLDIIFLFFALLIITWVGFYTIKNLGADPHVYEWYLTIPFITFYTVYLLSIRDKIKIDDRRAHTTKSMIYWILLGIMLVMSYSTPIEARDYMSINVLFVAFTLFLADSYWDFRKITMGSLRDKKEMR